MLQPNSNSQCLMNVYDLSAASFQTVSDRVTYMPNLVTVLHPSDFVQASISSASCMILLVIVHRMHRSMQLSQPLTMSQAEDDLSDYAEISRSLTHTWDISVYVHVYDVTFI